MNMEVIVWKTGMIVKQGEPMTGETNLQKLLKEMRPHLHTGEYVYCTVPAKADALALDPVCMFAEDESVTVILPRERAEALNLPCSAALSWITLTVHSSLEAVGLTAAFATALGHADISCNVVAAFYHDHIFVPTQDADRAMQVLQSLST
jgi:hypothetical protein